MKKHLITGFIILLPVAITILLFLFLIDFFTNPFLNLLVGILENFKAHFPILQNQTFINILARLIILVFLGFFVLLLGIVTRWFFFKLFIKIANKVFSKIPFVKTIYIALSDFAASLSSKDRKAFKKTVLVAFPSKDLYCVAFESGEVPKECQEKVDKKLISVFIPTAPHLITGFFVFIPENEVLPVEMKNKDTVKFILSCGIITPGEKLKDDSK
ncbi:MAG: DUF502 domain-containing protein [Parachlamydiales bacterium]|jgi:uncharacterized membrane protein